MNTKITCTLAAAALMSLAATSCNDDTWTPKIEKEGSLMLSSIDLDVNTAEATMSRASSMDVSNFIVAIKQGDEVVRQWTYAQMPEVVTLPVADNYTALVYSHEVKKQEWEAPYYKGSKDFKIESGVITEVGTVVCSFASLKVTVDYSDELRPLLGTDCKVTVMANSEGKLEYVYDETRAGYFEVMDGSNTLVAILEGTVDGHATTLRKEFTGVTAGTHYHITYKFNGTLPEIPEEMGDIDASGIGVNTDVVDVNSGLTIDIEEETINNPGERPGAEEPETPTEPDDPVIPDDPSADPISFEPQGGLVFDDPATPAQELNNVYDGMTAVIDIHSAYGFKNLNVNIASDNANFIASAGELLPLNFDLVNPGDNGEALASLGLPVGSDFNGQTKITFDITQFMPLLLSFPGTHTFTLEVIDSKGNTLTKDLVLKS